MKKQYKIVMLLWLSLLILILTLIGFIWQFPKIQVLFGFTKDIQVINTTKNAPELDIPSTISGINVLKNYMGVLDEQFQKNISNTIANLYTLSGDFQTWEALFTGSQQELYFLQWNSRLYEAYSLWSGGNKDIDRQISLLDQSISMYNSSALLLWTGNQSDLSRNLVQNRVIAYTFRSLLYMSSCLFTFSKLFESFDLAIKKLDDLVFLFQQELLALNKRLKEQESLGTNDEELLACLRKLYKQANESVLNSTDLKTQLHALKDWAIDKLANYVDDPKQCYLEKQQYYTVTVNASNKISNAIDEYLKGHTFLNEALQTFSDEELKTLCDQIEKAEQQENKMNQEIQEGMWALDNLYNKQQSTGNKQQENSPPKWNDQQQQSPNQPHHDQIDPNLERQLRDNLQKNADQWMDQMKNLQNQSDYNPQDYLKRLFKDFYGNWKDFENYNQEIPGQ